MNSHATPFHESHAGHQPTFDRVSRFPLSSLWNFHGLRPKFILTRTWHSVMSDHLFGHAAELGFYFLFALFPTLFCAGSILGLAARSASQIYDQLLHYLALVIPTSALGTVLTTFNETAAASSSGKITFGTIGAIWSASVGLSAIQDTLNAVYRLTETRSYIVARLYAIGLTLLLMIIWSLTLGCMFGSDLMATWIHHHILNASISLLAADLARLLFWAIATFLLTLSFAVVYSWAPDWKKRNWQWLTPGTGIGILGWLISSLGFRVYLHYFNTYSVTYGSLGAVVILLMWFYISGLMLLLGAEIDSEIDAAAKEAQNR